MYGLQTIRNINAAADLQHTTSKSEAKRIAAQTRCDVRVEWVTDRLFLSPITVGGTAFIEKQKMAHLGIERHGLRTAFTPAASPDVYADLKASGLRIEDLS